MCADIGQNRFFARDSEQKNINHTFSPPEYTVIVSSMKGGAFYEIKGRCVGMCGGCVRCRPGSGGNLPVRTVNYHSGGCLDRHRLFISEALRRLFRYAGCNCKESEISAGTSPCRFQDEKVGGINTARRDI